MKKSLPTMAFLLTLLITFALRLYPTLITAMPFSTDAWPLIRNTELLMQNTPVPLGTGVFDGYNNFWPANQIFGAVQSLLTGLPPITSMAWGIPIVAALAIPIFYLVVKKLTDSSKIALIASVLFSSAFPYSLFTAGVTKETFASPIYLSVVLLFLLKHSWKNTFLFCIASIALAMSHHLTAFLTISILLSMTVASIITKKTAKPQNSLKSNLLLLTILSTVTGIYFVFYALPAFKLSLSFSDLLSVGAYQILLLGVVLFFVLKQKASSKWLVALGYFAGLGFVVLMFSVLTTTSVLPGAPVIPFSYLLYALPFFLVTPFVILALNDYHSKNNALIFPLVWLVSIFAFAGYALLGNPAGGVDYSYRSINFLLPPLTILVALGLTKFSSFPKRVSTRFLAKMGGYIVVISMVSLGVFSAYATVSLQEPYLGYFWRYEPSEYSASGWLTSCCVNQTVAADVKVSYLLNGYFNQTVNVMDGLRYLRGDGSPPGVIYIYSQMFHNGYVLYQGSPVTLPPNWADKLSNYNCVYVNSEVSIYVKR
jgi:hypothetical protein